jgi:hypothetical protein
MDYEVIRNFIVGKPDTIIRHFKCLHCGEICSTYKCDRIVVCGGGFICQHCGATNMNSRISFIDKQDNAEWEV